jgi:hypothetical protein
MQAASTTAAWAEAYSAVGWRPFPLAPREKRPLYRGWQQGVAPDALGQAFRDERLNLGVICGEPFDVFDIEAEHLPALAAHMRAGSHSLPMTPVQNTGGGGLHVLVRPLGLGQTRLYLDGVHVGELKSTGGFIVVSPSVTDRQYTWRFAPAGMVPCEAPDWLRALVAPRPAFADRPLRRARTLRDARRGLEALCQLVARETEGNRNNALFWAACRALEEGSPVGGMVAALTSAARVAGLDDGEVERTLESAVRRIQ